MRYLLVAGEADTSRENVEAILEDYFYAHKGEDLVMVISFRKAPSRGQVYAMQMAKGKADLIVYAEESARLENIEKSSIEFSDSPIQDSVNLIKGLSAVAYLLCSDDGVDGKEALDACIAAEVPAYNLVEGGMPFTSLVEPPVAQIVTPKSKPNPKAIQEALDGLVEAIKESLLNGSK